MAKRGRLERGGQPLSAERIKQLYALWVENEPSGWRNARGERIRGLLPRVQGIDVNWLARNRPIGPFGVRYRLDELVTILVEHNGNWPHPLPRNWGDRWLTAAAAKQLDDYRAGVIPNFKAG